MRHELRITAYNVKYALTKGVIKINNAIVEENGYLAYRGYSNEYLPRKDWRRTEHEAMASFEEQRKRKIKSLEKQIQKLKSQKFKIINGEEFYKIGE